MDAVAKTMVGRGMKLKELPSYYFHRQCWISGDPDEKAFGHLRRGTADSNEPAVTRLVTPAGAGVFRSAAIALTQPARRRVLGCERPEQREQ